MTTSTAPSDRLAIVTRFAPSPTGYLHTGHAFAALLAWREARENGGRFLLRIEDIDKGRCKPQFEQAIIEDLSWLGLDWDGDVRRQSDYQVDHLKALEELAKLGVVYPCFCTRKDIREELERSPSAPHGKTGPVYPGICRKLSADERNRRMAAEPYALRIDILRAMAIAEDRTKGPFTWHDRTAGEIVCDPSSMGDVVLARKDMPNSYHLAVTVDDALQGVTLVTRGKDLFEATHIHRLLQVLLGYPTPDYLHHDLLTDDNGERLAKRDQSITIRHYRLNGMPPAAVRKLAGFN